MMKKWKEMSAEQKWQYFKDYYLFHVLLAAAVAALALFMLWHFSKPKEDQALYVAVMDESLDQSEKKQLQTECEKLFSSSGDKRAVMIDDSFFPSNYGVEKLQVYLRNGQIDVIIANEEEFRLLAGYGYMQDMKEVLGPQRAETYENCFFYAPGYRDSEEVAFEDRESGQGPNEAYGIDISRSSRYITVGGKLRRPVLGIAAGAENPMNGAVFLNVLMEQRE